MSLREDLKKDVKEEKSLRERANQSRQRRKKELRAKMILLNSGLALIIIMVVLICKVVSLNSSDDSAVAVTENTGKQSEVKNKDSKQEVDEKKAVETPKPTEKPQAEGTARWIRKDLNPDKPMVALTFDDGPYAPVTKKILATLKKYDARATFFCVGNRVPGYADVVKQAYDQGCQLASHTYEHKILTSVKKQQIISQIKKTDSAFEKIIGCHTTALRPPGGAVNDKVRNTVKVPMVCWNVDSEDWKSRNAKKILQRCRSIGDGDIVLMHDLYPTTAKAVATLVPKLKKKGFQLVTVDEMFYYKGIQPEGGKVYFSGK